MNKAEKLRWGILGASRFARTKSVPGMRASASCALVGLASREADRARAAADELGIPRAYGSYQDLLDDPEIEAVYIPLPNHLHAEWSTRAARAGKHVLCEKPITMNASEAQGLVAVEKETGRFICEAFMVHHHPQWHGARRLIDEGHIGDLRAVQCAFSYHNVDPQNIRNRPEVGGGALYDIGCYAIYIARFLFGREPVRVAGATENDAAFGVDRLTSGILDFGPGQCTFSVGTQQVPYQRVQILGSKGRIEIEIPFNAPPDRQCRLWLDDGRDNIGGGLQEHSFPAVDQYAQQVTDFRAAIHAGKAPANSAAQALCNMRVIDALFQSSKGGRWERTDSP